MEKRIAGYRIVRSLGAGRTWQAFLAHPAEPVPGTEPVGVALLMQRPNAPVEALQTYVSVLSSVRAVALPRLLDVGSVKGGACLLLEAATGPTLAQWASAASGCDPGELVTALAPVVATVEAMHRAGWAVGDLDASHVRFTATGRPVLTHVHSARPLTSPAGRAADVAGVARFVDAVVALAGLAESGAGASTDLAAIEAGLFDWADPRPVDLSRVDATIALPARVDVGRPTAGLIDDVAQALDTTSFDRLLAPVQRFAAAHRRPLMVGVGVLVLAGLAISALPAAPTTADAGRPTSAPTATVGTASAEPAPPEPAGTDAIMGDDPAAAVGALLAVRRQCLAERSAICLAAADQAGSPLLAADTGSVVDGIAASEIPMATPTLVERTGDAAIVSFPSTPETRPASLLLMKGEAGWRLREVFD